MSEYSLKTSLQRHPEITKRPVKVQELINRFGGTPPRPPNSLAGVLIKMGPFVPTRHGFRFSNSGTFKLTVDQATDFLELVPELIVKAVAERGKLKYLDFLSNLKLHAPVVGDLRLTDAIVVPVIERVLTELTARLADAFIDPIDKSFGRCGGMAFAGYDYYQEGTDLDVRNPQSPFATAPAEGRLEKYIYDRLLESIRLNISRFLEWTMIVHLLPKVDEIATATLLAVAGSAAFPFGTVIGALIGSRVNIFNFGGPAALLAPMKREWEIIKKELDGNAALPVGLIYKHKRMLWDQHQVLAVDYTDDGLGTTTLDIWDNNDGARMQTLNLDFSGDELVVSGGSDKNNHLAGIFHERYIRRRPPLPPF